MRKSLIVYAVILFGSSGAIQAEKAGGSDKAHVVIDRGVLTASSNDGVLHVDLKTGVLDINMASGAAWQTTTPLGLPPTKDPLARFDFMSLDAIGSGAYGESSMVCETEANTVSVLAALLTTVCVVPNTLLCTTTMTAFGHAVDAFRDCLSRVVQQEK